MTKSAYNFGDKNTALKAASSIAELSPMSDTELGRTSYLMLMIKDYTWARYFFYRALEQRNNNQNYYRGLGLTEKAAGNFTGAESVYLLGLSKSYNSFHGDVKRILREELAYVYKEWMINYPQDAQTVLQKAKINGIDLNYSDLLRVTIHWQTEANDVDLHIMDPWGETCFYAHKYTASGLKLYQDITQGLGPEVQVTNTLIYGRYRIGVKYFSSGSMGTSRGVAVIMRPNSQRIADPVIVPFALDQNSFEVQFVAEVVV